MAFSRTQPRDVLGELMEEARWVECVGELGRGPVPVVELDAMLEALMQAQRLRRRLAAQLALERAGAQGSGGLEGERHRSAAPCRRQGERKAS